MVVLQKLISDKTIWKDGLPTSARSSQNADGLPTTVCSPQNAYHMNTLL